MSHLHRWPWTVVLLLILCGCAPAQPLSCDAVAEPPPSPLEMSEAMGESMPSLPEGAVRHVCAAVSDLRCGPTARPGRLQCALRDPLGIPRVAVVERTGRTEWERRGHWRWVRGWRGCGILP